VTEDADASMTTAPVLVATWNAGSDDARVRRRRADATLDALPNFARCR